MYNNKELNLKNSKSKFHKHQCKCKRQVLKSLEPKSKQKNKKEEGDIKI